LLGRKTAALTDFSLKYFKNHPTLSNLYVEGNRFCLGVKPLLKPIFSQNTLKIAPM
jgi:hypothetical protein